MYAKCRTKADAHDKMGFQNARITEGGQGVRTPLKNHNNIEFLSNTGPDPLKFSKLPSQHSTLGHHRHASETPFKGVSLAGRWPAFSDIWILSTLKKKKKKTLSDQIRMEFRKECFANLNIWACDRKHAKHQYCRISDFVVQKPMRRRSISKYHFQHRYMIFFEITRDSYASASLSLSTTCFQSFPEDLRHLAKPNKGQTGIPRINHVSERLTLRPMPRKNIIEP